MYASTGTGVWLQISRHAERPNYATDLGSLGKRAHFRSTQYEELVTDGPPRVPSRQTGMAYILSASIYSSCLSDRSTPC